MADVKGIVMSVGEGHAVILTPDGEYRSIKTDKSLVIGEFHDLVARPLGCYVLAGVVILVIILGIFDYFSVKAYAQISGEIQMGINRWGRVITTGALNEEGQHILKKSNLKNIRVEEAVQEVIFIGE